MKKNNNKGFLLTELLVTATLVATVLIFLYAQFYNVKRGYEKSFNYNSVNNLYTLGNVRSFLIESGQIDVLISMTNGAEDILSSSTPYYEISKNNYDIIRLDKSYFLKLIEFSNIKKLYFTRENLTELRNKFDSLNSTNAASEVETLRKFISYIDFDKNGDRNRFRLIAEYNDGSFATLLVGGGN